MHDKPVWSDTSELQETLCKPDLFDKCLIMKLVITGCIGKTSARFNYVNQQGRIIFEYIFMLELFILELTY